MVWRCVQWSKSCALWPGFGFVVGVLVAGVLVGVLVAGVGSGLISD